MAVVRPGGDMLIESLGIFGVIGFIVTVIHLYRTPVIKDIGPFTGRQRHVDTMSTVVLETRRCTENNRSYSLQTFLLRDQIFVFVLITAENICQNTRPVILS